MSLYFATAFFEQLGHGWTETYYRESGALTDLAAIADFDREHIWIKRARALGVEGRILAQRVSFDNILGDSVLNYIVLPGDQGFHSEDPNTSLLVRFGTTSNTRRKNTFFRGIADDAVIDGGQVSGGPALFVAGINTFLDQLIIDSYGWKGTLAKVDMPVTGYVHDPLQRILFTLEPGSLPPQPVGTKIVVRGKNLGPAGKSTLNTSLPCVHTAVPDQLRTIKPRAAFPFPGVGGFLTSRTYGPYVIANHRAQKIDSRRAGKVSNVQAGRSRVRPLG